MKKQRIKSENVHYFKILGIVFAAIGFYAIIINLGTVGAIISNILSVFSPVIIGLCIAFILNMPMRFFENRVFGKLTRKGGKTWTKLKRPVCLILSVIAVFSIVGVLLPFVIPKLIESLIEFFKNLPAAMDKLVGYAGNIAENLNLPLSELGIDWKKISEAALGFLSQNSGNIAEGAMGFVSGLFSGIVNFILGFALAMYILASKETLGKLVKSAIYAIMKREHARKLISVTILTNKAFTGFISGQCIEVLVIGLLCFIGTIFFIPKSALLVSCIIAVTAFIPIFGPFIGTAIGAFFVLVDYSFIMALIFVIFIIVLQQIESNVIYPKIMGKHVGLPGIWVLVAVTLGGGFFGLFGILVSVPVCSVLYALFDKWVHDKLTEKNICRHSMTHDSSEPKEIDHDTKETKAHNNSTASTENAEFDDEFTEVDDDDEGDEGDEFTTIPYYTSAPSHHDEEKEEATTKEDTHSKNDK